MPQDKRRSISYRSFVTCDNPKGVVECGTIRKSKINSQKRDQQHQHSFNVVEGDKKLGNPNTKNNTSLGVIIKEGKKEMCIQEITRELDVSKGANKMNHVTNSWSKGKDHQEEIIAKDLLRGALDLQESLVMLGKVQEEAFSSLMSRSRLKPKHKVEEGTFDCMVNGVSNEKLHMGFQRPKKSIDGMKKAVRDSLLRQNVITNPIFEEHFDHRMMGCSDMPSTSSSQSSSMIRSSNFVPSDSSSSSTFSQKKKKESNLIVRLMGLESPPSSPRWHKEVEKIVNLPRARKNQYSSQVIGNKQRSVDEILETLHFKGLLRSSSVNGMTSNLEESEVFPMKNEWYDERPPIVIMKPLCYPSRDFEEPVMPKFWLEGIKKPSCRRHSFEGTVINSGENFSEEGRKSLKKDGFSRAKTPRKSSEIEKVSPTRRKGEENNDAKLRDELKFRDQEKLPDAPKMIKQKDGRIISKQQNVTSISTFDQRKQEINNISGQWKKNRQSGFVEENKKGKGKEKEIEIIPNSFLEQNRSRVRRNQIREYNVDTLIKCRQNDKQPVCDIALTDTHEDCNGYDDTHSCYSEITSVSTSEHYSPVCEVTLVTTHENGLPVHGLVDKPPSFPYENKPESSKESPTPRTTLQTLLLNNPSFLNNLNQLFDIQVFRDLVPYDVGKDSLVIDYANEVIQPYLPNTWIYTKEKQNLPSLDQLLKEIENGIEDLKHYHRSSASDDNNYSSENLYLMLDRDLRFKSGMWEIGWRRMFSQEEFELVVREVGKLILGKLIEEVVLDFMALWHYSIY